MLHKFTRVNNVGVNCSTLTFCYVTEVQTSAVVLLIRSFTLKSRKSLLVLGSAVASKEDRKTCCEERWESRVKLHRNRLSATGNQPAGPFKVIVLTSVTAKKKNAGTYLIFQTAHNFCFCDYIITIAIWIHIS